MSHSPPPHSTLSVLVLGALLTRFGKAKVSLPGGCAIGTRPVDLHLSALEKMGARIEIREGYILAFAPEDGLHGAEILFPKVTVGGTETILMAAVLAKGTTVLHNAAQEPEITDLANCLIKMGAKITGLDTPTLTIEGVDSLHGAEHSVITDRIEAATYAIAAAITRGRIEMTNTDISYMGAVARILTELGVQLIPTEDGFIADAQEAYLLGTDVMTETYPGFPTDVQAQMMALLATASGASLITETIFENRFMHVPELMRMGANINERDFRGRLLGPVTGRPRRLCAVSNVCRGRRSWRPIYARQLRLFWRVCRPKVKQLSTVCTIWTEGMRIWRQNWPRAVRISVVSPPERKNNHV